MNHMENLVQKLDATWDENGFFDHLRSGIFNVTEASGLLSILRSIDLRDQELVPALVYSKLSRMAAWEGVRKWRRCGSVRSVYH